MNDSTLTQLKIMVERAVRPLRASTAHKRKIREELLAHVSGVFEEEAAKLGDTEAALTRTQERFGQAAELTGQLQASIPRSDWYIRLVEHVEDFRPGESTLRRAGRHALLMFLVFGTLLIPVFLIKNRFHEWPVIPAAAILVFCFTLVSNGMRDALFGAAGRSWLRVMSIAVVAALLVPAVTFGICLFHSWEAWESMLEILPLLLWSLVLAWVPVVVTAFLTDKELRYRREWDTLQLD
jgi:hypothetical protein